MRCLRGITILFLGIGLLAAYDSACAVEDSDEQISTVTLIIQPACHLSIANEAVSETLVMDSSGETAFDAGFVELEPDKPTLEINSNQSWKLFVKSSGFTGPYSKIVGDLMLKDDASTHVNNGFTDYKSLSATDQEIASYNKGVRNEIHPCQYKILLDYEKDTPGTYEATVTYTLSTSGA